MNAESDLPFWLSQAVAALGPAQAELLGRLTSEPRMKRVWREFGRRRRSDGAPLYPVGAPKLLLMEVLKLTKERTLCAPRADHQAASWDDRRYVEPLGAALLGHVTHAVGIEHARLYRVPIPMLRAGELPQVACGEAMVFHGGPSFLACLFSADQGN